MATEILEVEVQSNIKGVTKDVDDLGKSVKKTTDKTKKLDDAAVSGAGGFAKVGIAVRALGVAIKAIGIGLIISGFIALKEAFTRNQKAADFLKTSMTTLSITFNEVVEAIVKMVEWVQKNSAQFEPYTKVMKAFLTLALDPFKLAIQSTELAIRSFVDGFMRFRTLFGADLDKEIASNMRVIKSLQKTIEETGGAILDAASDIVNNFGDANNVMNLFWKELGKNLGEIDLTTNWELADSLTEIEKEALAAAVRIQGLIEENDRLAETERRNRDDITKTYEDRIDASNKLLSILEDQQKEMLKQAEAQTEAARLAAKANSENFVLQLAHQEALNAEKAIEAQINGFLTEQLMAHNALIKEEKEVREEVRLAGLSDREKELKEIDLHYKALKKKANALGEDTTKIQGKWDKAKADLAREGVNAQLEAFSGLAKGLSALAGDNKALAVASAIIDTYVGANKAFAQGGVIGYVTAAGVIAAGLANVNKILQTEIPGEAGGDVAPTPTAEPPSPQMMQGAFTLEGGRAVEPTRAYVVSDDITDSQNSLAIIRRRATI